MSRVLVLYGTSEGQTAKIARAIADSLIVDGMEADLVEAGTLDPRPSDYAGVIVAGSIHAGGYQKPVAKWIRKHLSEFGSQPTALVSVCLAVRSKQEKDRDEASAIPRRFVDELGWHPTLIKVVAGALPYTQYNLFTRLIMRRIVSQAGGDTDTSRDYEYTDWKDLGEFAHRFAALVAPAPAARRNPVAAAVIAAMLIVGAASQAFARADPGPQAIQAFERATHDYVRMHRRLESQIGAIQLNTTVAELNRIIDELAAAIRAERPDAKQGDFFTPALAAELRTRINNALCDSGFTPEDVRQNERLEAIEAGTFRLRVNDTFPWALATAMFPCVIAALPPLSSELQYRIVGDTLVLVDVHASLILDLLPHALAGTTTER